MLCVAWLDVWIYVYSSVDLMEGLGPGGEERRVRELCVLTNDAVPSAASRSVDVPGGQSGTTSLGQKVAVSLPIQKRWPLALTDWRCIGLAERAAMR